jgi:hypothetical protein
VLPPTFVCDSGVLATRLIVACRLGYELNLTRSKQAPDSSRTSRPSSAERVGGRDREKASLSLSLVSVDDVNKKKETETLLHRDEAGIAACNFLSYLQR